MNNIKMKKDRIPITKKTKRLKLTFFEALAHYLSIIIFFGFAFIPLWTLSKKTYTEGGWTEEGLIIFSLIFLLLAILLFFVQYRRLKFKEFNVTFTDKQFKEAVDRTVNELKWLIEQNNENFLRAYRPFNNWSASWGEKITIIKGKDRLLMNSICDPEVISWGWNRRNIKTFLKNLSDVLENKEEKEKKENKFLNKA